jgi:hypothetical protein
LENYRGAPSQADDMPNFDDADDVPAARHGNSTALSSPGPILSPDDPRYGRPAGSPQVYSHQAAPQGPVMSPDDPRYGRPYSPSPAYSDRGNSGYGSDGMRPPAGMNGQGTVTGSVPPMPMGSDGRPTSLSALPPDDQPEADEGGEAQLAPNLRRQEVTFVTKEPAGTIVVDTANTIFIMCSATIGRSATASASAAKALPGPACRRSPARRSGRIGIRRPR